jgi:hypothetical protein
MSQKGFEVKFGGRAVTFFPLSLSQLKAFASEIEVFGKLASAGANSKDQFDAISKVFLASANRGDSKVTAEDVDAVVDVENLQEIMQAVMGKRAFQLSAEDAAHPTSPLSGGGSSQA